MMKLFLQWHDWIDRCKREPELRVEICEKINHWLPCQTLLLHLWEWVILSSSSNVHKTRYVSVDSHACIFSRGQATLHLAVLVGRLLGTSVRAFFIFLNSERFLHCPCQTIRNWIAVYPALFFWLVVLFQSSFWAVACMHASLTNQPTHYKHGVDLPARITNWPIDLPKTWYWFACTHHSLINQPTISMILISMHASLMDKYSL